MASFLTRNLQFIGAAPQRVWLHIASELAILAVRPSCPRGQAWFTPPARKTAGTPPVDNAARCAATLMPYVAPETITTPDAGGGKVRVLPTAAVRIAATARGFALAWTLRPALTQNVCTSAPRAATRGRAAPREYRVGHVDRLSLTHDPAEGPSRPVEAQPPAGGRHRVHLGGSTRDHLSGRSPRAETRSARSDR